jgi:hypothetical protein
MSELVGIKVRLSQQCQCGETALVVGPRNGPHAAKLTCSSCSGYVGWLSKCDAAAASEAIKKHGRDGVKNLCKSTKSIGSRRINNWGSIND